ncbi:MAG: DUF1569 domain-containing protein [Candidatus Paceibacterota bacterium]
MKTLLDTSTRDELIARIRNVNERSAAQWGKMNVSQMLKHCTIADELYLGKTTYKQNFFGKLFGQMAMKNLLKDEKPLGRNTPTIPQLKNLESDSNIEVDQNRLIDSVQEYEHFSRQLIVHPFFGNMTREQIGMMAYKHIDHHLRQFNAWCF